MIGNLFGEFYIARLVLFDIIELSNGGWRLEDSGRSSGIWSGLSGRCSQKRTGKEEEGKEREEEDSSAVERSSTFDVKGRDPI